MNFEELRALKRQKCLDVQDCFRINYYGCWNFKKKLLGWRYKCEERSLEFGRIALL